MMILVTAEQMRQADRLTIEEVGLPGAVLMENAAQGAVRVLCQAVGDPEGLEVAAFCGRGNNGGDGLAMLRILANQGATCRAYLMCRAEDLAGDAELNYRVAVACGVEVAEAPDEEAFDRLLSDMPAYDLYLDAMLGTGLNSEVRGHYRRVIELLNDLVAPVMAVDIPSGLAADTGRPLGLAVRADITATFGLVKIGLVLDPGEHVGELTLVDISIPPWVTAELGVQAATITPELVADLIPPRPSGGHKGTFGHLLVLGGSPGKSGAVCLAALGGLRTGAGLVTVGLPAGLNHVAETKLTAAMSLPLAQTPSGSLSLTALEDIAGQVDRSSAMVLGPGLGTEQVSRKLARELASAAEIPMVVDADGLNALAGTRLDGYGWNARRVVLTPHPGEAARLLGCTVDDILADRPAAARRLANESAAVVVLKGARTVVAPPSGDLWVNLSGNPLLASGGSGDVLAGLIGGFLAQGVEALEAALIGVYVHGLAADLAKVDYGRRGLAAEELIDYLPPAFALLEEDPENDQDQEQDQ